MYTLPKDPVMLLSFVNMKLRDEFTSLDELAAACSTTTQEIKDALGKINYEYNEDSFQYISERKDYMLCGSGIDGNVAISDGCAGISRQGGYNPARWQRGDGAPDRR